MRGVPTSRFPCHPPQLGGTLFFDGDPPATVRVYIVASSFSHCGANDCAVIYAGYGGVQLSNGTVFSNITGVTIFVAVANVVYVLPAPAGRYLPSASECTVAWRPCPSTCPVCGARNHSLYPSNEFVGCGQRPPWYIQSCPWNSDLLGSNALGTSILGHFLQTIVPGDLVFAEYPIPCSPGIRGAAADNVQGQLGALCDGLCDAGFYCPAYATVDPLPCPKGQFCPAGSASPLPCPEGTYSNSTKISSSSECRLCPSGTSCSISSATPVPCAPGSMQANVGRSSCDFCPPGKFQSALGGVACQDCPNGTYVSINGSAECNNCLAGTSSGEGSTSCSVCAEGYYRLNAQTTATPQTCENCDYSTWSSDAVVCPKDTTLETLVLLPGHWRLSNLSRDITTCSGSNSAMRCTGGSEAGVNGDGYCGELYTGPE